MKDTRTCCVCHSQYEYCGCSKDKYKEPWHYAFCSENCMKVYEVVSNYSRNKMTANEAKLRLDNLTVGDLSKYGESYRVNIEKINSEAGRIAKPIINVINETELSSQKNTNTEKYKGKNKKKDNELKKDVSVFSRSSEEKADDVIE